MDPDGNKIQNSCSPRLGIDVRDYNYYMNVHMQINVFTSIRDKEWHRTPLCRGIHLRKVRVTSIHPSSYTHMINTILV